MADEAQKENAGAETGSEGSDGFEELLFGDGLDDGDGPDGGDGASEGAGAGEGEGKGAGEGTGAEGGEEGQGEEAGEKGGEKDGEKAGDGAEGGTSYDVLHQGRFVSVPESDIAPLLQKGLDFDRLKGERDRMSSVIEFYASQSGMSAADYLAYVSGNMNAIAHDNAKRAAAAERPDLDDAALSEIAHARVSRQREAAAARERAAAAARNTERNNQFLTFVRKFPDVKPESIPADVIAAVRGGANLIEEYGAHRVREAEKKLAEAEATAAAAAKNADNAARSLGSTETAGGERAPDAFLSGLDA
ncbi:MAG: hypothetical protein LBS24_07300 [Clostridiales Family XIII bacterium]|jgi:hypothetical protein|nr:hypothetical protein [Clostridiales Family XIII bacterium]